MLLGMDAKQINNINANKNLSLLPAFVFLSFVSFILAVIFVLMSLK